MSVEPLVLVAEDDRFIRKACVTTLSRLGLRVVAAEDGEQAIALYRRERPSLVLLDILMPIKSGVDVLRAIRDEDPTVPVIVLSNSSRESEIAETRRLGITDYLIKANLSLAELGARVRQVLEEAR